MLPEGCTKYASKSTCGYSDSKLLKTFKLAIESSIRLTLLYFPVFKYFLTHIAFLYAGDSLPGKFPALCT